MFNDVHKTIKTNVFSIKQRVQYDSMLLLRSAPSGNIITRAEGNVAHAIQTPQSRFVSVCACACVNDENYFPNNFQLKNVLVALHICFITRNRKYYRQISNLHSLSEE